MINHEKEVQSPETLKCTDDYYRPLLKAGIRTHHLRNSLCSTCICSLCSKVYTVLSGASEVHHPVLFLLLS